MSFDDWWRDYDGNDVGEDLARVAYDAGLARAAEVAWNFDGILSPEAEKNLRDYLNSDERAKGAGGAKPTTP